MNPTDETAVAAAVAPLPALEGVAGGLANPVRWKMLRELSCGETRSIDELAKVSGTSYANAAKHLIVLREAGLVAQGRGRLYQIPKQYLPSPGQAIVDYGHCRLRLDVAG
jgi:DNA-binding transcriptional ArsR family regulator